MGNTEQSVARLVASATLIKSAFNEGFYSYETGCNSMITYEQAWEQSHAKTVHDKLFKEAQDIAFYS